MKELSLPYRVGRNSMLVIFFLLIITLIAGIIDERLLNGVSVWNKPTKFNVSFAVHVATLMVFCRFYARKF